MKIELILIFFALCCPSSGFLFCDNAGTGGERMPRLVRRLLPRLLPDGTAQVDHSLRTAGSSPESTKLRFCHSLSKAAPVNPDTGTKKIEE